MSSNNEHLLKRRGEILSAAEEVFDAYGYASTTMEAVAEKAGVSKGSLYNYFKSKHDLFVQVFSEVIAGYEATTEKVLTEPSTATQKLERFLDHWAERLGQYKRVGRLMLEFWVTAAREDENGDLGGWFGQMYARWLDMVSKVIDEGIASGEFHIGSDAHTAAVMILAILNGIEVEMIMGMHSDVDEAFLSAQKRLIVAALVAEPAVEKLDT